MTATTNKEKFKEAREAILRQYFFVERLTYKDKKELDEIVQRKIRLLQAKRKLE